ncbi:hypothetical protein P7F88_15985 [Vibrio hannami]|uniref:hypothetical protein n=1 Tax=Vibrio hannami TaxID=2717094 RepID=UPI00240EA5A7|nr:hypothetical protein [Vibrio hannami]MDG3087480.1 hypothetical protein [Vibrio hannami]
MSQTDQAIPVVDVKAAIELYDGHIKRGCSQLLELNNVLLKAERQQRKKQILYRLAWVGGLSTLVMIVSYLTIGINVITAVGLLAAYMAGILLHHKYSPKIVLPRQEQELYKLNDQLRDRISEFERARPGILIKLLKFTNQEQKARSQGMVLEQTLIDESQLYGNGLYQYLDAMNLVFEQRSQLDKLAAE